MFDTVTMVQGYAASQEEWDTQADALHDDLEHYHQLFDIYHHYDGMVNLYDVNARAGQEPVQVSRELFDFLQLCKTSGETLAGGAVNIAAGAVLSLWHDARESENPCPACGRCHLRSPAALQLGRPAAGLRHPDCGLC